PSSWDLKPPEGREIVGRLAARGDVVMENMRPGVADRLGVGWERLAALNPRLVYCSVTAFGSTGPGVERPGFDPIFQALGGVMTLQRVRGPPQYLRTAPTDYYTAALATQAIVAALFARERTGRGQRVETSLLRGVLALQSGVAVDYPGKPVLIRDNPTYRLYQTGDGQWFFLAVGNQSFWVKLCKALGLEHLADDPRFGSWMLRLQNNQDLLPILEARFREKTRAEWLEVLAAHDIPAAPVQPLLDFFEDPAVRHHDLVHEYDHPEVGRLRMIGQPLVFTETPTRDPRPPPGLPRRRGHPRVRRAAGARPLPREPEARGLPPGDGPLPPADHRRHPRLCPGRRARAGAGLRYPDRGGGRAARPHRGQPRDHSRRRRHPKAPAPDRSRPSPRDDPDWRAHRRARGVAHRARRARRSRGGRARR